MTYRVPKKDKKASLTALLAAIFSVLCFAFSSFMNAPVVYQLTGLVLAVVALQVYMKFVQSSYVYEVTENDLRIHKTTGKKSMTVCSMSLEESLTGVLSAAYAAKNAAKLPKNTISLNFCQNLFCEDFAVYYFNFNGRVAKLKFEPDAAFAESVNKAIAAAKKRAAAYAAFGEPEQSAKEPSSDEND